MSAPRRIALLGAESTGKTTLARELAQALCERGLRAVAVPEALRAWCEGAGREPRPEEQLPIAQAQEDAVDAAAPAADVVIADTTALMVAIQAGMLFEDGELLAFALARQRGYDLTLLTGLDLPWVDDGLHRQPGSGPAVDALLRSLLDRAGVAYQVVYGHGPRRLQAALGALESAGLVDSGSAQEKTGGAQNWVWTCDKCSDPACEHRLFAQLQGGRG